MSSARHPTVFAALVLTAVAGGLTPRPAMAQDEPPRTPRVAVVDIQRVFDEAPLTRELLAEVGTVSQRLEAELEDRRKQRDQLKMDAETFVDGARGLEAERARLAYESAASEYEHLAKGYFGILQRLKLEKMTEAFQAVSEAVAEIAGRRDLDLVLRINVPAADEDVRAKLERIQQTTVVYHGSRLDITGDVIRLLKASRPAAGDGTGGAPARDGDTGRSEARGADSAGR